MNRQTQDSFRQGFTLLEVCAVVLVISILAGISFPLYVQFKAKAEALTCGANMRVLYGGVSAYVQEHQAWPRILPPKPNPDSGPVANAADSSAAKWIAVLAPYGVTESVWHCPSIQREMRKKAKEEALKMPRIDYIPTIFEGGPLSPYQWPSHPWFIERGASHGSGPLIILADGSVVTVEELMRRTGK